LHGMASLRVVVTTRSTSFVGVPWQVLICSD
jgi:hypothetical protein